MGFEELIGAIGADAARQRAEIRQRAEAEARRILADAEAEGARLLDAAPRQGADAAGAEAARLAGRARLAARRELLEARSQVVAEALRALEERLRRLPQTPAYGPALGLLLAECAAGQEGPLTVRCRPEDRPLLAAHARERGLALAFADAPLPLGGLETVAGPEGRIVCRNGFADRLEAARPLLLEEAGRVLFRERAAPGEGRP